MERRKGKDLFYILGGGKVGPPAKKSAAQPAPTRPAARAAPSSSGLGGGAGVTSQKVIGAGAGASSA